MGYAARVEQIFYSLFETVAAWVEDRYGQTAAWLVCGFLLFVPVALVFLAGWFYLR